jgi:hypothetical protein
MEELPNKIRKELFDLFKYKANYVFIEDAQEKERYLRLIRHQEDRIANLTGVQLTIPNENLDVMPSFVELQERFCKIQPLVKSLGVKCKMVAGGYFAAYEIKSLSETKTNGNTSWVTATCADNYDDMDIGSEIMGSYRIQVGDYMVAVLTPNIHQDGEMHICLMYLNPFAFQCLFVKTPE